MLHKLPGQRLFRRDRAAIHDPTIELVADGLHDGGMPMPKDERAEAKVAVDILSPINIIKIRAFRMIDE